MYKFNFPNRVLLARDGEKPHARLADARRAWGVDTAGREHVYRNIRKNQSVQFIFLSGNLNSDFACCIFV
jgi:hypothetical protein